MILGSPGKVGRCQIYAPQSESFVGLFFGLESTMMSVPARLRTSCYGAFAFGEFMPREAIALRGFFFALDPTPGSLRIVHITISFACW